MKNSKLETKAKESKCSLFKRIDDYLFKLTAYLIDGTPMSKEVDADNKLTYHRF
jgi:hypothetical protein